MGQTRIVDWGLARRVAGSLAGDESGRPVPDAGAVRKVCDTALERVLEYTGLTLERPAPRATVLHRRDWIEANVRHLSELAGPLEERASREAQLPWPLGSLIRSGVGAATGAEAGVVIGYAARRVIGQYEVALDGSNRLPRLLVLGANLYGAADELHADRDGFLMWVALHEQTHAAQFGAVPWLQGHMAGLVRRLIESASAQIDLSRLASLARRLANDPREALGGALRGELTRALAGPEQAAVLDELQATMAVIEGYAEHVMDAAAAGDHRLASMRQSLDARRARRGGIGEIIARVLGLGAKLEQYELGKSFCDTVVARSGIEALNEVWSQPSALPGLEQLSDPASWRPSAARAASS